MIRDLSEISSGEGRWKQGGSQLFETAETGGIMKSEPLKGGGTWEKPGRNRRVE